LRWALTGEYYNIIADEMAAAVRTSARSRRAGLLTDVPGVKGADGRGDALVSLKAGADLERQA